MSTYIEGIYVENPTAVWMQLKNTLKVLEDRYAWNSEGWFGNAGDGKGFFDTGYNMCLANAVRYVTRGSKNQPMEFARNQPIEEGEIAEQITLVAINKVTDCDYDDIPQYNDEGGRKHREIVAVLKAAIRMVAPYAQTHIMVIADEVMTPAEREETRLAVWKAEDEMWAERRAKYGIKKDANGVWRTAKGHFAQVPSWVKTSYKYTVDGVVSEFRGWLDDHQDRGWDTFWGELAECDENDKACQEALAKV